ncbi:MAG: DUF2080 family transposase-associated protein [Thermoplasmatota archaeon]
MSKFQVTGDELLRREVKSCGNSCHVTLPGVWEGRMVSVILEEEKDEKSN